MRNIVWLSVVVMVVFFSQTAFAGEGHGMHEHSSSEMVYDDAGSDEYAGDAYGSDSEYDSAWENDSWDQTQDEMNQNYDQDYGY